MKKRFVLALFIATALFSCKKDPPPTPLAEATFTIRDSTWKFTADPNHQLDYVTPRSSVYVLHHTTYNSQRYDVYAFDITEQRNRLIFYILWDKPLGLGEYVGKTHDAHATLNHWNYDENTTFIVKVLNKSPTNFCADLSGVFKWRNNELIPFSGTLRHLKVFEYK